MTNHPDVHYLRAHWKMGRWTHCTNRDERAPLFGFYLRAEEGRLRRGAGA
jgi:hypothetical protein